jgi:hypothetical protein
VNVDIVSRVLPGIGVCQEVGLRDGRRIGIVTRRNGQRELVLYDEEGDGAADTIAMSDDEANAIAEILGGPQLTVRWRAGVALIPRGEFSVVVAALAAGAGAEARLGPLTACYVLLTIVLGAAVIRLPDRLRPERNVAS